MSDDLYNTQDFSSSNSFITRHIGPSDEEAKQMLAFLGLESIDQLLDRTLPASIRAKSLPALKDAASETEALAELRCIAEKNQVCKNYIGQGFHPTHVPPVILRNVLENPGWYTAYTPYQPEIAQGRLEGLLSFQQMIMDLTGMELANASMLDEATAAAEAMAMSKRVARKNKSLKYLVTNDVHPNTLAVVQTRAKHFGFDLDVEDPEEALGKEEYFGVLLQYPGTRGQIRDLSAIAEKAHTQNAVVTVAADLLSLVALKAPSEFGADIVVGSTQRFGVPMGYGGPHAAFFAFRDAYKRAAPGRIIGVSIDARGSQALRMAMQTREQHIRREKANSNICTSQVLPALLSVFYAIYHGPTGLKKIAQKTHGLTKVLATVVQDNGFKLSNTQFFDTVCIDVGPRQNEIFQRALAHSVNVLNINENIISISLNETTTLEDVIELAEIFACNTGKIDWQATIARAAQTNIIQDDLKRNTDFLTHEVFNSYHSETEMLRYLRRLESKDIALNHAMIPLGSCTMKLNATAEMIPLTWSEFGQLHPFAPREQAQGYLQLFSELESMLAACTGYDAISLQPNAGSQGEYAGLLAIKNYFIANNDLNRSICLIPASAHGTNPASAQMAGLKVVVTECDENGNVDINDLKEKIEEWGTAVAALMITYPSTHGVFEEHIGEICNLIHSVGAQVYIDGANLNALVGLAEPGKFGGDVSHLNLHKTFCIPHGGGGPGMGPIGVKSHLAPYLPDHPQNSAEAQNTISAAPWGSASILPISWMYIRMMGKNGVGLATQYAILSANYIAHRLKNHYPILYTGKHGFIAHECLLDLRPIKEVSGITEEDIAKRLMDFGFHAPTMSFPVAGTLMIEPTESESLAELNRFCDAMIKIRDEIRKVEKQEWPTNDNPLVNAPHTIADILDESWGRAYSKEEAAQPLPYLKSHKVWPSVNRIDNVHGDRHLMCSCAPIEAYT